MNNHKMYVKNDVLILTFINMKNNENKIDLNL